MTDRITTDQRNELRRLLRADGSYDLRTVTLMHRRLGVADTWIGKPADQWLDSLTKTDASRLIYQLRGDDE